jgi:hypothetical protein
MKTIGVDVAGRRHRPSRHEYRPSGDLGQDYELKVPFPAGRLGEADLEQIWRSPDPSALLVGDRLLVLGPTGGGHGDPFTRERLAVLDDVLDGYIGENFARQCYRVVIVDARLNEAAAARLRAGHMGG